MKLSALITKLTVIQNNFGDVEVLTLRINPNGQVTTMDLVDVKVGETEDAEVSDVALLIKDTL